MIRDYIASRLRWGEWLGLAILMSLLVHDLQDSWRQWIGSIVFLFISYLVFRMIDDAGSVIADRADHPERPYLSERNYPLFLRYGVTLVIVYAIAMYLWRPVTFLVLGLFLIFSFVLYLLFHRQRKVLEFIVFLKYGVLIWVLGVEDWSLIIVAILLMATYELLEDPAYFYLGLAALFACGQLLLFDLSAVSSLLLVFLPLPIALIFRRNKFLKYLPIVYFPLTYFILRTCMIIN